MTQNQTIIFSTVAGILPALFWLWYWLKEDRLHPEPKKLIFISFIVGMIAVFVVLPFERWAERSFSGVLSVLFMWALIEESAKLLGAYFSGLRKADDDEPIDPMIYLITVALGFSALENTLFLFNSLGQDAILTSVALGNMRFVGASLLHVLASGTIGLFLAYSFYGSRTSKLIHLGLGLSTAITLHTLFNFFIMKWKGNGTLIVFCFVWLSIVLFLAAVEKVKRLKQPNQT